MQVLTAAARSGHLVALQWAIVRGFALGTNWASVAAAHGRLLILAWLRDDCGCAIDFDRCLAAAARGASLESLQWICDEAPVSAVPAMTFKSAIRSGSVTPLEWLLQRYQYPSDPSDLHRWGFDPVGLRAYRVLHLTGRFCFCREAARCGHIDVLEWLQRTRPLHVDQLTQHVFTVGMVMGNVGVLRWATARGCTRTLKPQAVIAAASQGNLRMLQWVYEYGASLDAKLCAIAAARGDVEMLAMLTSLGCVADDAASAAAALRGRTGVLSWLHERGATFSPAVLAAAIPGGRDGVKWLIDRGCKLPSDAYIIATKQDDVRVLEIIREAAPVNAPLAWGAAVWKAAVKGGRVVILRWLLQQQPACPWDASVCAAAAACGDLRTLQWLRQQQPPCPWDVATWMAARDPVLRAWAARNGCPRSSAIPA